MAIELIRSRPEPFDNCSSLRTTPGIDPGSIHRDTGDDTGTIREQIILKDSYHARLGVGPGRAR
jgi:hypothetical protein